MTPVSFPREGLLDDLAARGGLRPGTLIDNVWLRRVPTFKRGPVRYEFPTGRMTSTSRFSALTPSLMGLLENSDSGDGIGGSCFFDSGGPEFLHQTNQIVGVQAGGGDAICRAKSSPKGSTSRPPARSSAST